jgi:hypothetical protein
MVTVDTAVTFQIKENHVVKVHAFLEFEMQVIQ